MRWIILLCLLCTGVHAEAYRVRAETEEALTADDTARRVVLKTRTQHSTCVPVGERELITAAHSVAEGSIKIEVGGEWLRAQVVRRDDKLDLALLRVEQKLPFFHRLAPSLGGLTVWASSQGEVVKPVAAKLGNILVFYPAGQGNSGAPVVLNEKNELMAIVIKIESGNKPSWAEAVPADVIRSFLKKD
jgi:hypothetical protein